MKLLATDKEEMARIRCLYFGRVIMTAKANNPALATKLILTLDGVLRNTLALFEAGLTASELLIMERDERVAVYHQICKQVAGFPELKTVWTGCGQRKHKNQSGVEDFFEKPALFERIPGMEHFQLSNVAFVYFDVCGRPSARMLKIIESKSFQQNVHVLALTQSGRGQDTREWPELPGFVELIYFKCPSVDMKIFVRENEADWFVLYFCLLFISCRYEIVCVCVVALGIETLSGPMTNGSSSCCQIMVKIASQSRKTKQSNEKRSKRNFAALLKSVKERTRANTLANPAV